MGGVQSFILLVEPLARSCPPLSSGRRLQNKLENRSRTVIAAGFSVKSLLDLIKVVVLTLVGVPSQLSTLSGVSASTFEAFVTAARRGHA